MELGNTGGKAGTLGCTVLPVHPSGCLLSPEWTPVLAWALWKPLKKAFLQGASACLPQSSGQTQAALGRETKSEQARRKEVKCASGVSTHMFVPCVHVFWKHVCLCVA